MDFLARMNELTEQKKQIEQEMKDTADAWTRAQGLNDGDKFIFTDGYHKGKTAQIIKGRMYRFLKKDGTINNATGLQTFWIYDMEHTKIEKV